MPATLCGESGAGEPRDLVFEWVRPGDLEPEEMTHLAGGNREVVDFRWNERTGELTYDTRAPTTLFSDLAASLPSSGQTPANCG